MSGGTTIGWRGACAVLVLGVMSVVAARTIDGARLLPDPACRFFHYYRLLEQSEVRVGPWQRLVFSLILTKSEKPTANGPKQPAAPVTSS